MNSGATLHELIHNSEAAEDLFWVLQVLDPRLEGLEDRRDTLLVGGDDEEA